MNKSQTLQPGAELRSPVYTYHIKKVLGQGAFGITYLATTKVKVPGPLGEIESEMKVAIKEYYLREVCGRGNDGTVSLTEQSELASRYGDKFRKEAVNLSHLNHPNIVKVLEVFDANATHYYVMAYVEGCSLDDYIERQGPLPVSYAKKCLEDIASALKYMHEQKMLHLDLKPKNIMLGSDGHLYLIDFGLSKQYEEGGEPESSTTVGQGTPGYSPIEQGNASGNKTFSPTLDIYALGATFLKMITGKTPPAASTVLNDRDVLRRMMEGQDAQVIEFVEQMMAPEKAKRPQNVDELLVLMNAKLHVEAKDLFDPKEIVGENVIVMDDEPTEEETIVTNPTSAQKGEDVHREEQGKVKFEPRKPEVDIKLHEEEKKQPLKTIARKWKRYIYGVLACVIGVVITVVAVNYLHSDVSSDGAGGFTVKGVPFKMIKVDGGTFQMGATSEQGNEARSDEKPVHSVTLSSYYIGKTEVTQALWEAVMGKNPSHRKGEQRPAECVSWNDCQKFISKLNSLTGKQFRLPTEAEWEFAARGGNHSCGYKYSGGNRLDEVAWFGDNSYDGMHNVGTKSPNELGLYDMSGNAWEWCSDWYGSYGSNIHINSRSAGFGSCRVLRGGSWHYAAMYCRVSGRRISTPAYHNDNIGLRLALSAL